MSKDPKRRGIKLELRHDNVDWVVRVDRDLTITMRPKRGHAARTKTVLVRDVIDWVRGVQDLPIPRAEIEQPAPEPVVDPEIRRLEAKAKFQASLRALTASRHPQPQPEQTAFA
jgi:hypothetical protein